jgi:hypothetical protein
MKTVMLGLGYQVSINADISCSFEGWLDLFFFSASRENLCFRSTEGSGFCWLGW